MVVVQITAGLGNQLFQYAAARSISLRTKQPLYLDLAYYSRKPNRAYRLAAYQLPANVATEIELENFFTVFHKLPCIKGLIFRFNKLLPFSWKRIVQEGSPHFDARLSKIKRSTYLSGFWQCDRYFAEHAQVIRRELILPTSIPQCYLPLLAQIMSSNSVGLVVRRGDYLGIPNTQGICTLGYYRRALAAIAETVPDYRVFVFSDDIPWCRENFRWIKNVDYISNETPDRPEEHLRILSKCNHFILANSSYAWWGAWLGEHPKKLVVGPEKWMQKSTGLGEILPNDWRKISIAK